MAGPTDAELLIAAREDGDAFADFYRRHVDRIVGYFASRVASPEVAADLMAETFAAAFSAAPRFRPSDGPAVAWLFAIAHSKLVDAYRHGAVQDRARRRLALEPIARDLRTSQAVIRKRVSRGLARLRQDVKGAS